MPRTAFLGTSDFAAAVLAGLVDRGEPPVLVLTRPDRPQGRGRRVSAPPVASTARELQIRLAQPADINGPESLDEIQRARPDLICVCAFGALIREPLLTNQPLVNVHPSLLPRWRGAAPMERTIMAGDRGAGVSIMRLGAGLDDGPVGLVGKIPVGPHDTYGSLAARLAPLGAELLTHTLRESPPFRRQDETAATYAHKIAAEERRLDPRHTSAQLERTVRALTPHIGAYVALAGGMRLGVLASRPAPEGEDHPGVRDAALGDATLVVDGERLLLPCAGGALELMQVQPPGGRVMDAAAYVRGHAHRLRQPR